MEGVEAEGRTVSEATNRALETLGLTRNDVEVEVLSEGRPRLLGFGGEPARVRVTPIERPQPVHSAPRGRVTEAPGEAAIEEPEDELEDEDEEYEDAELDELDEAIAEAEEEMPAELRRAPHAAVIKVPAPEAGEVEMAVTALENLLQLMDVEADVTPREPETAGDGLGLIEVVLDVDGEDLGILIGRRGQTLAALQYVLNLIVSKQAHRRVAFGVDVDGYRRRREEALVTLAKRMAERVRGTGRSVTLEPMPPNERRIVHITLAEDPAVMTVSIGEGEDRKVAITPSH
jgi:spoIIIJ-associated protein